MDFACPLNSLGKCINKIEQGWSPSPSENNQESDWHVLSLAAVKEGRFNKTEIKPFSGDKSRCERLKVNKGDFLLTRSNTREYVGAVCLVNSVLENIIETSQRQAYHAVDTILSQRNWLIGYRIAEEEIDDSDSAEYGANIIKKLSKELTAQYGKGYDRSNLYHCLRFYKEFPQIVDTVCRQSHIRLSWSHYRA